MVVRKGRPPDGVWIGDGDKPDLVGVLQGILAVGLRPPVSGAKKQGANGLSHVGLLFSPRLF
jgi:hypothetical protein